MLPVQHTVLHMPVPLRRACGQPSTQASGSSVHNHRGCTACHSSRPVCMPDLSICSCSQFVCSCSTVLEELHRMHGVCSSHRRRCRHYCIARAAAAQHFHAMHTQQQPSFATYTPLLSMVAPADPPSHPDELLKSHSLATALGAPATAVQHHAAAAAKQPEQRSVRGDPGDSQQQQQQQRPDAASSLRRPTMVTGIALRQLLQQQVQSAVSWRQLQQLLADRRDCLTLKHLGLMVMQVAHLQVWAHKQRMQQLHRQYRYQQQSSSSSRSSSRHLDQPPDDLLSNSLGGEGAAGAAAAAAVQLGPFLLELACAVTEAVQKDPGLARRMHTAPAAADGTGVGGGAAAATVPGTLQADISGVSVLQNSIRPQTPEASSSSSSSSSGGGGGGFSSPPASLSGYLANVLWGFAKLNHTPPEDQLLLWVEAFSAVCAAADAVSFSQVCWALGHLQFWPGEDVLDALAAELARRMAAATAVRQASETAAVQHPSNSSTSDSSMSVQLGAAAPAAAAEQSQHLIGSRALSNILWAFAALGYTPAARVLDSVWSGSVQVLGGASPQALSNMAWAVASLGLRPSSDWMAEWESAVSQGLQQQQQQQWNSVDLAHIAWAFGKFASSAELHVLVPSLPLRLAVMRAARAAAAAAAPRELVCLGWGLTTAGVAFSATFTDKLLAAAAAKRIHFKAREWSQLLLVLAKQGVTPPPAWQRCCHAVMASRLRFMTAVDFATGIWGIAQLGVEPRQTWRERFFSESYRQLFFLTPSSCCALVWALGRLRWRPPLEWQDRLFLETYTKLAGFHAAELTGTLHGLAALQLQPPVQWMHQATAAVGLAAPDLGPQELTTCLWAISKLRYRPPEPWLASLAAQAAQLLPAAWKPTLQQQEHSHLAGSSIPYDSSAPDSAARHASSAAHLLQAQQQRDRQEAGLRRRRQQLLQQVKQLDQQRQALLQQRQHQQPGGGPRHSSQQQQVWWQQQQQQEQKLLQLRGDLELLQVETASSKPTSHQHHHQQQQQLLAAESLRPGLRWLGYHDVGIVLAALSQLQYTLDRSHELVQAAQKLGLLIPPIAAARRQRASAADRRKQTGSNAAAHIRVHQRRSTGAGPADGDDSDTFTPGPDATRLAGMPFTGASGSQPNCLVPAGLRQGLHVPPTGAMGRRHDRQYVRGNDEQSYLQG